MTWVENCARRHHRAMHLLHYIEGLIGCGKRSPRRADLVRVGGSIYQICDGAMRGGECSRTESLFSYLSCEQPRVP
jgi:hypothetical protein